ncbi:PA domain-containing protein [Stenotrophomonas sp.]|uniref:PA domain-containing protein n=1 Tax=Stenotrophomonas sp. TaxID=69392 RepID=UPI0028B15BB1|nr:PA domain-containing protein [Stenotrophomonas sp.]
MKKTVVYACIMAAMAMTSLHAHAQARMKLVNIDRPGVGLNDPTPVQSVGGNPGKTLGQQRLIAYQYAMDIWGALLRSSSEIRVEASFSPLECAPGRIVLGQAGTNSRVWADAIFPDGAYDYTYPIAMADALAGYELRPGENHIMSFFSSEVDQPACQALGANGWYYGLTGDAGGNTLGRSNFLNVIMHELAHGLGVEGVAMLAGSWGLRVQKSPWDEQAWSNIYSMNYNQFEMSADPRLAEAITADGETVWKGRQATRTAGLLAEHRRLLITRSPALQRHDYQTVGFGDQRLDAILGEIVLVNDVVGPDGVDMHTGCDGSDGQPAISNAAALAGKVVLVDRGGCEYGLKALNAQRHGAIAVILANNVPTSVLRAGGGTFGRQVNIPVITVTQGVGAALRVGSPMLVSGFIEDPKRFYGLDSGGYPRLYTPSDYQQGSSFSHIDTDMTPNALMEPAINRSLRADVAIDVTLDLLEDMGWPTNRNGTAMLGNCDTTVPVYRDSFIPGANLVAQNNLCRASSQGNRSQQMRCMNDHISSLHAQTLITPLEVAKARQCVARI